MSHIIEAAIEPGYFSPRALIGKTDLYIAKRRAKELVEKGFTTRATVYEIRKNNTKRFKLRYELRSGEIILVGGV